MNALLTIVFLVLVFGMCSDVTANPSTERAVDDDVAMYIGEYDPPPMPAPPSEEDDDDDDEDDEYDERSEREAHKFIRQVTSTYDYDEVLAKSIKFYEAQRAGPLPSNNRISFRGDSAVNDSGFNGEDLTGGYYDAGDHVKFGLPMAFTSTVLAWGLIEFKDAYEAAGQLSYMYETIKWATDYFIKAHVSPTGFYSQVGEGNIDHKYWGPPESMKMSRPPVLVDGISMNGSDVVGETAAAMAAASIAFDGVTEYGSYSAILLEHAKQLFDFAYKYQGKYEAGGYYKSFKYGDELCWAAAWLYKATGENEYLTTSETLYDRHCKARGWAFGWGNKNAGAQMLLYQLTGNNKYKNKINQFVTKWMPGHRLHYTPLGLVYRNSWGPLRYAAGTAMIALIAADNGINTDNFIEWAKGQIHYMLGDAGRSFVVGFGHNPPVRPHHRASSCNCILTGSRALKSPHDNPNVLVGALVGGPSSDDSYTDNRQDYMSNEVACDYNAAFQSSVAALRHFQLQGRK
ncbi:endoglucanase E-4-like [Ptychodera flava]|uniref:endoglucanase E-4-like n=1 Tax=Ptychodera flava TaxID=63121 RepID=UPI003969F592